MKRTLRQNASLHLYIRRLAEAMADAGKDMRKVITVDITPDEYIVKETMIKPVMRAMFPGVESTRDLTTTQIQTLYETINRATSNWENGPISIPFPSEEEAAREAQEKFYAQ